MVVIQDLYLQHVQSFLEVVEVVDKIQEKVELEEQVVVELVVQLVLVLQEQQTLVLGDRDWETTT